MAAGSLDRLQHVWVGADDCVCPACLAEAAAMPAEAGLDLVQSPPEAAGALDVRTQRPHAPGQLGV